MAVARKVAMTGSQNIVSYPAASRIPVGAAVVVSSATAGAETIQAATNGDEYILGIAGNRDEGLPKGKYDMFYEQYEMVPIVQDYAYALVTPNRGNYNIDLGDFLEVAVLASTSSRHGVLEEAGTQAGGTGTALSVARAMQSVTMGSTSYAALGATLSVGDTTATVASGAPTTMGLSIGDYILLEDIDSERQVNRVTSLTATTIGLEIPSTVGAAQTTDYVSKLFWCKVKIL